MELLKDFRKDLAHFTGQCWYANQPLGEAQCKQIGILILILLLPEMIHMVYCDSDYDGYQYYRSGNCNYSCWFH